MGITEPLMIELFAGLHGWGEGALAEGFHVRGYDIVDMCAELGHERPEGIELVIRDVRSIHGSECKDATVIVGSSPCQEFSYRAMPWKRAKDLGPPLLGIELFQAQFRIQREASEAAGRYIPLIVENVRGAEKWVGRAKWHYGSFYLWGDVPALMPITFSPKVGGFSWSDFGKPGYKPQAFNGTAAQRMEGIKVGMASERDLYADRDSQGVKQHGSGHIWYRTGNGALSSKSNRRKAASALIAKIPFPLAQHIARAFKPVL